MEEIIIVYLNDAFGHIDEDEAIKVYNNELWSPEDASMRGYSKLVRVYDDYDEVYYVNEDVVQEISDRMF